MMKNNYKIIASATLLCTLCTVVPVSARFGSGYQNYYKQTTGNTYYGPYYHGGMNYGYEGPIDNHAPGPDCCDSYSQLKASARYEISSDKKTGYIIIDVTGTGGLSSVSFTDYFNKRFNKSVNEYGDFQIKIPVKQNGTYTIELNSLVEMPRKVMQNDDAVNYYGRAVKLTVDGLKSGTSWDNAYLTQSDVEKIEVTLTKPLESENISTKTTNSSSTSSNNNYEYNYYRYSRRY